MTNTFIHKSWSIHPETKDHYTAYNRPIGFMEWFEKEDIQEEYILIIDPDMTVREPIYVEDYNVSSKHAVANLYSYLRGAYNPMSLKHIAQLPKRQDTLAGPYGRRADTVGAFMLLTKQDLEDLGPKWLNYTEAMRQEPEAWKYSGDSYAINPGDKPWISEMYGYIYGTAALDIHHIGLTQQMSYPGHSEYHELPRIIHNGLIFTVPDSNFAFDKHWYQHFDVYSCPPWPEVEAGEHASNGLFPHPPDPSSLKHTNPERRKGQLIAIETASILNEALCEYYIQRCPAEDQLIKECTRAHTIAQNLEQAYADLDPKDLLIPFSCQDKDRRCKKWANSKPSECHKNVNYMAYTCPSACGLCDLQKIQHNRRTPVSGSRKIFDISKLGAGYHSAVEKHQEQQQQIKNDLAQETQAAQDSNTGTNKNQNNHNDNDNSNNNDDDNNNDNNDNDSNNKKDKNDQESDDSNKDDTNKNDDDIKGDKKQDIGQKEENDTKGDTDQDSKVKTNITHLDATDSESTKKYKEQGDKRLEHHENTNDQEGKAEQHQEELAKNEVVDRLEKNETLHSKTKEDENVENLLQKQSDQTTQEIKDIVQNHENNSSKQEEKLKQKELADNKLNTHDQEYDEENEKGEEKVLKNMDISNLAQACFDHKNLTDTQRSECVQLAKEGKRYYLIPHDKNKEDPHLDHQQKVQEQLHEIQKNLTIQGELTDKDDENKKLDLQNTVDKVKVLTSQESIGLFTPFKSIFIIVVALAAYYFYRVRSRSQVRRKTNFRKD